MDDIIHDTDYSGLCVMVSAVCRLFRREQLMTFRMRSEPRGDDPSEAIYESD